MRSLSAVRLRDGLDLDGVRLAPAARHHAGAVAGPRIFLDAHPDATGHLVLPGDRGADPGIENIGNRGFPAAPAVDAHRGSLVGAVDGDDLENASVAEAVAHLPADLPRAALGDTEHVLVV